MESDKIKEEEEKSSELPGEHAEHKIITFEWSREMEEECLKILKEDENKKSDFMYKKYEDQAKRYWDVFYKQNTTNFFKNRNYLDDEFKELREKLEGSADTEFTLFEIGCGVGNAFFPLVEKYKNIKVYGVDISPKAVELITKQANFDPERIFVKQMDIVKESFKVFPAKKVNFGTLIYVLSAISPENHAVVAQNIADTVLEGGILYFRDYGRYDLAQIRFASRKDAKLKDNFYVRNDGTRAYYFLKEEVKELFEKVGFEQLENEYIYRQIENKKENLTMKRVWIQAKFVRRAAPRQEDMGSQASGE